MSVQVHFTVQETCTEIVRLLLWTVKTSHKLMVHDYFNDSAPHVTQTHWTHHKAKEKNNGNSWLLSIFHNLFAVYDYLVIIIYLIMFYFYVPLLSTIITIPTNTINSFGIFLFLFITEISRLNTIRRRYNKFSFFKYSTWLVYPIYIKCVL